MNMYNDGAVVSNIIDAYDINLVHDSATLPFTGPSYISSGIVSPVVTTPDRGYLFYYEGYISYDTNFVRGNFPAASIGRALGAVTTFQGDKILYGGGGDLRVNPLVRYDNVDLYRY